MSAKKRYQQAMEWLYMACILISGTALVVITLIIPLGVFMRYAMNNPLSWPEPASVIMMVMFSFRGGAAVYRANLHIAVEALLNAVKPNVRRGMLWAVDACMGATALFIMPSKSIIANYTSLKTRISNWGQIGFNSCQFSFCSSCF